MVAGEWNVKAEDQTGRGGDVEVSRGSGVAGLCTGVRNRRGLVGVGQSGRGEGDRLGGWEGSGGEGAGEGDWSEERGCFRRRDIKGAGRHLLEGNEVGG